ncbi:MAG TPA: hypothetical protein VF731_00850 [Solirubrobacterales bacterium]
MVAALALVLSPALPASAAIAREEADGARVLKQIESGELRCGTVSATQFDHVGEYAMGRALGSPARHEAMNEAMRRMMGEAGETRMHVVMGRRIAGCGGPVLPARFAGMMGATGLMAGGGMMGGAGPSPGSSGWVGYGPMMSRNGDGDLAAGWIVAGVVILVGATAAAFLAGRRLRSQP